MILSSPCCQHELASQIECRELSYVTREPILKQKLSAILTDALRCRLLDMGLIPKTRVCVTKIAPLGDPIELRVRDYTLSIRLEDARRIEVHEP